MVDLLADVDECSNAGTCSENSVCKNSAGSYDCKCNDGYRKNELNDNCEGKSVLVCFQHFTNWL